jgi:hypothetical protein
MVKEGGKVSVISERYAEAGLMGILSKNIGSFSRNEYRASNLKRGPFVPRNEDETNGPPQNGRMGRWQTGWVFVLEE